MIRVHIKLLRSEHRRWVKEDWFRLVNVLRQYIATPQIRQDPEMTKILNTILESSGLSPIMFGPASALPQPEVQQGGGSTQPLQALGVGGVKTQEQAQV